MKRARQRQHGFALLLTLVLLMMAAIVLAASVRRSADAAMQSSDQTEALKRRWAVTSCRATLLPRVSRLLTQAESVPRGADGEPLPGARRPEPTPYLWVKCKLADIDYEMVLTDEQTKYNPTVMGTLVTEPQLEAALRSLGRDLTHNDKRKQQDILLRPMVGVNLDGTAVEEEEKDEDALAVYYGYGQVFTNTSPRVLLGTDKSPGAAMRVTCWGDGRLNLGRAPISVVKRTLFPLLGADGLEELLEARRENPGAGLNRWMGRVVSADPGRKAVASYLMTDVTQSQGLWVVAHGRTRSWYTLSVRVWVPPDDEAGDANTDGDPADTEIDAPPADPYKRYDYAW